jgi:hypothetical protein
MCSEDEIDELVIAQADDDSAWEAPVKVKKKSKGRVNNPRTTKAKKSSGRAAQAPPPRFETIRMT